MPSLSEIAIIRLVGAVNSCNIGSFQNGRACKKYFFGKLIKFTVVLYKQNKSNNATIRRLLINTAPAYMPIDEILIVRLFLCSL